MVRGTSEVLLAASERRWVGGTLSLVLLLALSANREGALYYPRAQSKPEADTPKTQWQQLISGGGLLIPDHQVIVRPRGPARWLLVVHPKWGKKPEF